ncbi:Uu.00g026910.m01.CDS01 [Anthostomella pinea]|uniref:Uu.00g026910.m01.CDS01 n=1 Tax=Anthostomella pinea TaxID=933095 RepID=A0AAI8V2T8_9PEZI|nr:Uu.00g026910.m01.CDS01 [Anthostomella pinea]
MAETPEVPPTAEQRLGCLFYGLQQEMRDKIFQNCKDFWCDPAPIFGRRGTGPGLHPLRHSLALLRVRRRMRNDIVSSWIRQVVFNYESVPTMMRKLAFVPDETGAMIRHLRVRGNAIGWRIDREEWQESYLDEALDTLSGLRLDSLTVLASYSMIDSYRNLDRLINKGMGWKALRFIACNTCMLDPVLERHDFALLFSRRQPQPSSWRNVLLKRDGAESLASLALYRSATRAMAYSSEYRLLEKFEPDIEYHNFGNDGQMSSLNFNKPYSELICIVRRGAKVEYEVLSPETEDEIQRSQLRLRAFAGADILFLREATYDSYSRPIYFIWSKWSEISVGLTTPGLAPDSGWNEYYVPRRDKIARHIFVYRNGLMPNELYTLRMAQVAQVAQ